MRFFRRLHLLFTRHTPPPSDFNDAVFVCRTPTDCSTGGPRWRSQSLFRLLRAYGVNISQEESDGIFAASVLGNQAGARLTSFPHHANPFMDIVDFADALGAVAKRVYGRAGDSPSGAGPSPHAPPPLASERGGRGRGTRSLAGALAKHASPAGTRK